MLTALFISCGFVIVLIIAIWVTSIQSSQIKICYNLKSTQNKLLLGKLKIEDVSEELLLRLRFPKLTHIGIGGVGPAYIPGFMLWCMVVDELKRRRELVTRPIT